MTKTTLNIVIDAMMLFVFAVIAGIGILLKYTLITGQERWIKYNQNVELYIFNLNRHEWGELHLTIGYIFIGLLIIHIILHWKSLILVYNRLFKNKIINTVFLYGFVMICVFLIILPLILKPRIEKIQKGKGRQNTTYKNLKNIENLNCIIITKNTLTNLT